MSLSKLHPSLPAPVVHNSHLPNSQSKSHVLAGVQDAYWSDEDAEDAECPLCLEEMDISDINFKPCPCGYQICRFCWHHIKENLNRRCPACRREYSDEAVEFKPINKDDHKRLTQQKKQRDRERKELDALGRRHLLNVRIVQRNVVYVVGLGSKFAKEELISTLRSNDYFGQYGKITKILLVKRTPPGGRTPVLGLYITYHRREDAARAIAAVDGSPSPSGGGDVMRASYGTTKYCSYFLRGLACTNSGCMDLHEWGDEKDCFTKEDLTTLKHTMKDTESRQRTGKKAEEGGLPRTAGWGQKPPQTTAALPTAAPSSRSTRRGHRSGRSGAAATESRLQSVPAKQVPAERRAATKTPSQASSSRPSTPALVSLPQRPVTPALKQAKAKKEPQVPLPPRSPTSSVALESDVGSSEAISASPALSAPSVPPPSTDSTEDSVVPPAPPGLMIPPPGLAPSSTDITREPSASSYQISSQARALLDDVVNRRELSLPTSTFSPFPDLDRTLQILSGGDGDEGGFSFNLDPKLAIDDDQFDTTLPSINDSTFAGGYYSLNSPFGSFGSQFAPSGVGVFPPRSFHEPFRAPGLERTTSGSSSYTGSFNPFSETQESASFAQQPARSSHVQDDDSSRRVSRFGFARERQGSLALPISSTSSPLLSANTSLSSLSLVDNANPPSASASHSPWPFHRQQDFGLPPGLGIPPARTGTPGSARGSPLVPHASAQIASHPAHPSSYVHSTSRFQPFDLSSDEPSLNDLLGIGSDHMLAPQVPHTGNGQYMATPLGSGSFHDPAIMSSVPYTPGASDASFSAQLNDGSYPPHLGYGRPPGLQYQQTQPSGLQARNLMNGQPSGLSATAPQQSPMTAQGPAFNQVSGHLSSVPVNPPMPISQPVPPPVREPSPEAVLSAADFPALPVTSTASQSSIRNQYVAQQQHILPSTAKDETEKAKAEKKAAKKAAAAEKAAERIRIAKEKEAGKERIAREKAEERSRAAKEKAEEKERITKEKEERDRALKEKVDREEKEKAEKARLVAQRKLESEKGRNKIQNQASSKTASARVSSSKPQGQSASSPVEPDVASPSPILSKMPKKNKPATKPIKLPATKEDDSAHDSQSGHTSAVSANATPQLPSAKMPNVSEVSASESEAMSSRAIPYGTDLVTPAKIKSIAELLAEIDTEKGPYYLDNHPFFDVSKIITASKVPLDYGTMSRALSAFPLGGMSFSDDASARLNDETVASFQQLLETLTQTMSDLVQLLPQTTWGSIFDVLSQGLKDMKREHSLHGAATFDGLVQDDLSDDLDDEDFDVDPPTPTMDKRAKWMEIQLAKLEDLHRDVNAAAVRAILTVNDRGWDARGFLPHISNTLQRFEQLGLVDEDGRKRPMSVGELEKKLVVAKEAAVFAETELKEAMHANLAMRM